MNECGVSHPTPHEQPRITISVSTRFGCVGIAPLLYGVVREGGVRQYLNATPPRTTPYNHTESDTNTHQPKLNLRYRAQAVEKNERFAHPPLPNYPVYYGTGEVAA